MLLKFRVDLQASVRRGVDCPIPPVVSLDVDPAKLSQADRNLLAPRLHSSGVVATRREDGGYFFNETRQAWTSELDGSQNYAPVTAETPRLDDLLAAIRRENEAISTLAVRQQAEKDAKLAADQAVGLRWLNGEPEKQQKTVYVTLLFDAGFYVCDHTRIGGIDYVAANYERQHIFSHYGDEATRAACKVRAEQFDRETSDRRSAAIEEAKRKLHAEHIQPRLDWIAVYGSSDLQRMVAEDLPWMKVYNEERTAWQAGIDAGRLLAERPGWVVVDKSRIGPPIRPRSRAWAILDAARQIDPSAKLGRIDGKYVAYSEFNGKTIIWPAD